MVPTLAWFFNVAEAAPSAAFGEEYIRKGKFMAECSTRSIALAREAGVKIAAGTDTGAPLVPHNSLRRELELLVRLGSRRWRRSRPQPKPQPRRCAWTSWSVRSNPASLLT